MPTHPEVLWAQRSSETDDKKNVVYLTVNLPDIVEETLKYSLQSTKLSFEASAGDAAKVYSFDLDLYAEVKPEESSQHLSTRSFSAIIRKKENKAEFWPRLTKEKVKNAFIKTDFSKWVDEDEQDGAAVEPDEPDMSGMGGMGGMGGLGGMGGMGGMDGGMDFEKMMAQMGNMGGGPPASNEDDADNDSDEDGPPPLEDADPIK